VGEEVTALYTTGPSGGGGVRVAMEERIGVVSTTIDRDAVTTRVVTSPDPTEPKLDDFFSPGGRK
jgi:hypothetical protein